VATIKESNTHGNVLAVCVSGEKGVKKRNIKAAVFKEGFGIISDAHAGSPRQVSLLSEVSIAKMRKKGLNVKPGDFAENIVTKGIDLKRLNIGAKIKIGKNVILEITQLGKECLRPCAIYYKVGDCIMPREGVFAKILKGGVVKVKDVVQIIALKGRSIC
jgi:molybdopterin adenylyltransferase